MIFVKSYKICGFVSFSMFMVSVDKDGLACTCEVQSTPIPFVKENPRKFDLTFRFGNQNNKKFVLAARINNVEFYIFVLLVVCISFLCKALTSVFILI